jgi:hypothetical protein
MLHEGLSVCSSLAVVKTVSSGRRLTRPAPLRIACAWAAEMPLLLLRMLPASLMLSSPLPNLRGGAKSSPVNVLDFLSRCLDMNVRCCTTS